MTRLTPSGPFRDRGQWWLSMNFNTTNMTFRQLMANGQSYRVPQFQRDYSWDVDHWDDLWLDIVGLFGEESESAHYMGYLVLQSADSRSYDIIDGQQRMATLSVLMLASVSHLMDLAVPDDPSDPQFRRAEQLRSNYIGYLDPVTLVPRSKLTLNRHNDQLYQDYLIPLERLPQRGLNASEHLLRRAFHSFKDRIKDHCGQDGQSVARFVDTAVDKLFFTVITVTDRVERLQGVRDPECSRCAAVRNGLAEELPVFRCFTWVARMTPRSRLWKTAGKPSLVSSVAKAFRSSCACSGTAATGWRARRTCSRPYALRSATRPRPLN